MKSKIVKRTQQFIIKRKDRDYKTFIDMGIIERAIYNKATYLCQKCVKHHDTVSKPKLEHDFKVMYANGENNLYKILGIRLCQQMLKVVYYNFESYFKSLENYKKHPKRYKVRPKLPSCFDRNEPCSFVIDNQSARFSKKKQQIRLRSGQITKRTLWWKKQLHNIQLHLNHKIKRIQQTQVIFYLDYIKLMVVYNLKILPPKYDNHRYLTIDPGQDNLMCVGSNCPDIRAFIIDGHPINAVNGYTYYKVGQMKHYLNKVNKVNTSHRLRRLFFKRRYNIHKYMHMDCNYVIKFALKHHCNTIVMGTGASNTQEHPHLGKNTNAFMKIPFKHLLNIMKYKCQDNRINFVPTEESYTSQTSFLDGEYPNKSNSNKARAKNNIHPVNRRLYRGLFRADCGILINADLNGALQILKKKFPKAFKYLSVDGMKKVALAPVKITLK